MNAAADPLVAVVILNYNGFDDTVACLESLGQSAYRNFKVVVVDNGSGNDEARRLRDRFGELIHVIENGENLGFAGGCNVGIKWALGYDVDYVLLLNNDTVVHSTFLDEMVKVAANGHRVGAVGPKILNYAERSIIGCVGGGRVDYWFGRAPIFGWGEHDSGQYDQLCDIGWAAGGCLLLLAEALRKLGFLDEHFFLYFDETDFAVRLLSDGYKIRAAPSALIWHKEGKSTTSLVRLHHGTRSNLLFMRKHARPWHWLTFLPFFFLLKIPNEMRKTFRQSPGGTVKAVWDALAWNARDVLRRGWRGA